MRVLMIGTVGFKNLRGRTTPSTVVRCENMARELEKHGITVRVLFRSLTRLPLLISEIKASDVVFLHRIQYPDPYAGPFPIDPVIVALCTTNAKPLVFDLDDSLHLQYPFLSELIAAKSQGCSVGSHYLRDWAVRFNRMVSLIPSAVDTNLFNPDKRDRARNGDGITLGWHGTALVQLGNLRLLREPLTELSKRYDIEFKLLGSLGDARVLRIFREIRNLKLNPGPTHWIRYAELPSHLTDVDIGLSPLVDTAWSRGKCAMKAIEYMSMRIPTVASAVGEHNFLITDGQNGFLTHDSADWVAKVGQLIEDSELRRKIGSEGRKTVLAGYSLSVVGARLADMLRRLALPRI